MNIHRVQAVVWLAATLQQNA